METPPEAYHTARLRGAVAADCGTCVEAEINPARNMVADSRFIDQILSGDYSNIEAAIAAVAVLTDAVVGRLYMFPVGLEHRRIVWNSLQRFRQIHALIAYGVLHHGLPWTGRDSVALPSQGVWIYVLCYK